MNAATKTIDINKGIQQIPASGKKLLLKAVTGNLVVPIGPSELNGLTIVHAEAFKGYLLDIVREVLAPLTDDVGDYQVLKLVKAFTHLDPFLPNLEAISSNRTLLRRLLRATLCVTAMFVARDMAYLDLLGEISGWSMTLTELLDVLDILFEIPTP